jgi:hypothetical protein
MRTVDEGNIWISEGEKIVGKRIELCNEEFHDSYLQLLLELSSQWGRDGWNM